MRSRSFNTTDKFEIGRCELTSVVFRLTFLTIGVMNTSFYPDEKWPLAGGHRAIEQFGKVWCNQAVDLLQNSIRLVADDLLGNCQTASMTSSTLTDKKAANETPG